MVQIADDVKLKFEILKHWFEHIVETVKKELKQDHLAKDRSFHLKYFKGKPLPKLPLADMSKAYWQAIFEDEMDHVGESICNFWILKHSDIYQYFALKLEKINPQFDQIEILSEEASQEILQEALQQFPPLPVYIFSVLNCVAFSDQVMSSLKEKALQEVQKPLLEPTTETDRQNVDILLQKQAERFEKKLQGLQRKYTQDVEGLKKQIAALHRQLAVK